MTLCLTEGLFTQCNEVFFLSCPRSQQIYPTEGLHPPVHPVTPNKEHVNKTDTVSNTDKSCYRTLENSLALNSDKSGNRLSSKAIFPSFYKDQIGSELHPNL